ncbi:hypothetical protein JIQ42_07221 [Leishmania sp. Namibia]|uniref:hypothetical protein n=1 Tax=Leishmania sp. Namibia TaxID=2802991 RepID=UPI001B43950D|nr:hypothetical protein JIQ42_07221 [Leishmania sp. Namibia]
MPSSRGGSSIGTTRTQSATLQSNTRRAWPLATSANIAYDSATARLHYRLPSRAPPAPAVTATVAAPSSQRHQQQAPSPRYPPSATSAITSTLPRRGASNSRNIPFHSASRASAEIVLPPAAAAQRGNSKPPPHPSQAKAAESHQQHLLPLASQGAASRFASRGRQPSLSPPQCAPRAGSSGRHFTSAHEALLSAASASRSWRASSAPSTQRTLNCATSSAPSAFSLPWQRQVGRSVAAVASGSRHCPPVPTTPNKEKSSPDAPSAHSRGVRSEAEVTSSRPLRQTPWESPHAANAQARRPLVRLESAATIPAAQSATQWLLEPQLNTASPKRTTSPPAATSVWRAGDGRNAASTDSQQQRSSSPVLPPAGAGSAVLSARPPPPPPQQPQPSSPLNYHALAPSLQLTQHRHQREHLYAFTAADDMGSMVSEASSRTRLVFRQAAVAASGIPVGSPYGAVPAYMVVMPRNQRRVSPRAGAFAASARHLPLSASAEAAQQQHRSPIYTSNSSRPSPQEGHSRSAREQPPPRPQPPAERPVPPQHSGHHGSPMMEATNSQPPPPALLPADVFPPQMLNTMKRRQGTASSIASTRQVGHRGGHAAPVPSQQQQRQVSSLRPFDVPISARPSRATVVAPMPSKWSEDNQHLDGAALPMEEEEVAPPPQKPGAASPRHPASPAHTMPRGDSAGYARRAAARGASEHLPAAEETTTVVMATAKQPSQRRRQPPHEAVGSPCGDGADGLYVVDDRRMSPSRPQLFRHRATADPRQIQRTTSPRGLVLECSRDLRHSVDIVAGLETNVEQKQRKGQLCMASLGGAVVVSAGRNRYAAKKEATLAPPASAPPPPAVVEYVTERDYGEQSSSMDSDDARVSLTPKSSACRGCESTAALGAAEAPATSQDVDSDVLDAAEECEESEKEFGDPSTGAEHGAKVLQEAENAMAPTGAYTATAALSPSAVVAPPLRTSLELDVCAEEEPVGVSPLAIGERYVYVDPLEEASMDATYMMDTLEQQYVRINEETNEEMEDAVNVVELHRRDRAAAVPRSFVPKGLYSDVLPMLRYPVAEIPVETSASTAAGFRPRSALPLSADQLTYFPLTEAAYVNLCATVWLSRFDAAEARSLLAMAQGSARNGGTAASRENKGISPSAAEEVYYFDHPSANLLSALDVRLSAHVHALVLKICAGGDCANPCSYETACLGLTDRHNIDCLPHSLWADAAPKMLSLADHVTNVLLTATVPREAERRRAAAAKVATAEEVAARRAWPYFLGASPWDYEVAAEKDAYAAMPTAAARLAYAFMHKTRLRNVDGGVGSLMFSILSQQVPEAAFIDCLLMQEKLRLALLHSRANIVACCALRQHALYHEPLHTPRARMPSEETPSANASTPRDESPSASIPTWTTPVLSTYRTLYERSATPPARRPSDGAPEPSRLDRSPRADEGADTNGDPVSAAACGLEGSCPPDAATPVRTEESGDRVDLYSVAVQLNHFFPTKTQRGMHQLCAALVEDLISMDALPVPEEVVTPEGAVLTDRTSIIDALVAEGAQAMRHIITVLSARRAELQPKTVDRYRTLSGSVDAAAVQAAMEKRLILFDPAVMYFLSTPVPVNDLFQYVVTDGPPSMQPQGTGRKSAFVEALRLQHVAETVQYTMEMQDAILVAGQLSHLVAASQQQKALAGRRDRGQKFGCFLTQPVAEEPLMDAVVGHGMNSIGHPESSASLLAVLGASNGERTAADELQLEGLLDLDMSRGGGSDVSVRAVLIALCCADQEKPVAEAQAYLRHLLALYFELRTSDGNIVDSNDPQQIAVARLMTTDMAMWDWFGDTTWNGTLRAGAAPAKCDRVRVHAEELASLCPRVLGRRVGIASTVVADAAAAVIAASAARRGGGGAAGAQ